MSVQEIERQLESLTPEELARVESFVRTLRKVNSEEFKARVARSHAEFEAGQKVSSEELRASVAAITPSLRFGFC